MEPILALDTVELVLYIVSFLMYLVMIFRISRWDSWGWWMLLGLCSARIIGAVTSILYWHTGRRHQGRISGAALVMGLTFLLHNIVDILGPILLSMAGHERKRNQYYLGTHILIFATAIVGAVGGGGTNETASGSRSKVAQAAAALCAIIAVVQIPTTVYCLLRWSKNLARERYMLVATALSLPFVLVLNAYVACCAFVGPSDTFSPLSTTTTGVLVNAMMTLVPDLIILAVFFWAGSKAKLSETNPEHIERRQADSEAHMKAVMDTEKISDAVEAEMERGEAEKNDFGTEGEPPPYSKAEPHGVIDSRRQPDVYPQRSDSTTICEPAATADGREQELK